MDLIIGIPTKPRESADPYNGEPKVALQPNSKEGSKSKVSLSYVLCDQVGLADDAKLQIACTGSFDRIDEIYLIPHEDGVNVTQPKGKAPRSFLNKKIHQTISDHFANKETLESELLLDTEIVYNPTPDVPWAIKLVPVVSIVSEPLSAEDGESNRNAIANTGVNTSSEDGDDYADRQAEEADVTDVAEVS